MTINNNLIKFNNLDCFRFDNFKTEKFINLNICCQICKKYNINIFIIYNNYVYYRSQTFKDCIKNLVYKKDAIM